MAYPQLSFPFPMPSEPVLPVPLMNKGAPQSQRVPTDAGPFWPYTTACAHSSSMPCHRSCSPPLPEPFSRLQRRYRYTSIPGVSEPPDHLPDYITITPFEGSTRRVQASRPATCRSAKQNRANLVAAQKEPHLFSQAAPSRGVQCSTWTPDPSHTDQFSARFPST